MAPLLSSRLGVSLVEQVGFLMISKKEYLDLDSLNQSFFVEQNEHKNRFFFKRICDVLLSSFLLLALSPMCLLIALLIVLESPGGVIFFQNRSGLNGTPFKILKFRTMYKLNSNNKHGFGENCYHRVTKVGRILRKHRIDELPQLLNVLKGEMSIIGPRPEQVEIYETLVDSIPSYQLRTMIKPGITGWAQVKVGYTNDVAGAQIKVAHDLYYIQNASLQLELKIALHTLYVIFTGFGSK